MHFVRAAALCSVLGLIFAAAGCSGGSGGTATPPLPIQQQNPPATTTSTGDPAATAAAAGTSTSTGIQSTTTAPEDSTITSALKSVKIVGPIVAVKSGGGFQVSAGGGIGYVWVYPTSSTHKFYNGLTPAVGEYALITATGNIASTPNPLLIALSKTAPASTSTSGTVMSEQSYGVAVKIDATGQYIPIALSSVSNLQGYVGAGVHVSISGIGSPSLTVLASTVTSGTSSTSSTTTSTGGTSTTTSAYVPSHILTAAMIYGYGGTPTSVSLSAMAPWVTWATTDSSHAPSLRSAGIKVYSYANFWRNYSSDNPSLGYTDLKPGGAHAAAEAKNCSGQVLYDNTYGGGYEADARSSAALGHAQLVANYFEKEYGSNYDALFADDAASVTVGGQNPCGYSQSTYDQATNTLDAALKVPLWLNALGAGLTKTDLVEPSNVLGAMCEMCYSWNSSTGDKVSSGSTWIATENSQITVGNLGKVFWAYPRASGYASYETALRMYVYASLLLGYSPGHVMLQEVLKTNSGFEVLPEVGLVPTSPVTTSSTVGGYLRSGGAYMREYGACYYRGVNKGRCAVVVNPNGSGVSVPTTAYSHSMVLSGSDVLSGGSVSFSGSRPSSLGATSAAILFP
jgi:hypothetical protein